MSAYAHVEIMKTNMSESVSQQRACTQSTVHKSAVSTSIDQRPAAPRAAFPTAVSRGRTLMFVARTPQTCYALCTDAYRYRSRVIRLCYEIRTRVSLFWGVGWT